MSWKDVPRRSDGKFCRDGEDYTREEALVILIVVGMLILGFFGFVGYEIATNQHPGAAIKQEERR